MRTDDVRLDRFDNSSKLLYMAHGASWVMCRRPGCKPFCMPEFDWSALRVSRGLHPHPIHGAVPTGRTG